MIYYYTINTTATNRKDHDPVANFCDKISGYSYTFFGKDRALVAILSKEEPKVPFLTLLSDDVYKKTGEDILKLADARIMTFGFDAKQFIEEAKKLDLKVNG